MPLSSPRGLSFHTPGPSRIPTFLPVIPASPLVIPAKAGIQVNCRTVWIPGTHNGQEFGVASTLSTAAGAAAGAPGFVGGSASAVLSRVFTSRVSAPGFAVLICERMRAGFARGSSSAVLTRVLKQRASGEPKARPLTIKLETVDATPMLFLPGSPPPRG